MAETPRTLRDILNLSAAERRSIYSVDGKRRDARGEEIHVEWVEIDGVRFTDYGAFSFIWEKSYVNEPTRAADGNIDNLDSIPTFIVPHLKIDFGMMSIDAYRCLMKMIYAKNEFTIKCYDVVYDRMTINKMYFTTEEMPKLWFIVAALNSDTCLELLGVQDYVVEMVGTYTAFRDITITYKYGETEIATKTTKTGYSEVVIGQNIDMSAYNDFNGWWVDDTGARYKNETSAAFGANITLYAETNE